MKYELNKGDFVTIGNDTGVIVFLTGEKDTPAEHVGIWFGETNEKGNPKYRTVPIDY
ncbi:hypothetical protein [Aquimarina sp. 2201CG14-23]|uniref:hypothetical protein n=1 Tax=Aquimarina mycalae TaxID=3040073 RepID=UPI002477E290|nr:hypothetical protein [Aquimarina sp. 2201CG14-23]MDH7447614.1 hypothetical protein [Aquimarina sp. 2201CG14-23]